MTNSAVIGELKSSPTIQRYPNNPILKADDVPYHATLVFNAGIVKFEGRYVMVFRNDFGDAKTQTLAGTNIGMATSKDGKNWNVNPQPCWDLPDVIQTASAFYGKHFQTNEIERAYDPRLTVIDGRCYMCFALDTAHGLRGGVAVTDDFTHFEILSLSLPDNRNMVLLPERIDGRFVRLERPMPVYSRQSDRFDVWLSDSPDLKYWGGSSPVLAVEHVPFANDKIGPAAPPIKTDKGWLTTFHAVDIDPARGKNGWEATWKKRYTAGIMLLDLGNPRRVIGMSKTPLIAPETPYETDEGFRTNVIFPGGMILEDDGEVKIYYGASDTVECLATAHVDDLIGLCTHRP